MTRRERLERKLEKRQDWAAGRRSKAAQAHAFTNQFRGDHAFNTQPGHIPLRARVIRVEDRAREDLAMANHHEAKADGLERQLETSVFSDDDDAIEQLEKRIAENEAKRDRMKLVNKLYKKGDAAGLTALGLDLEKLKAKLAEAGSYWGSAPHLPYELTNLGARIRADKERIEDIKRRRERTAQAEAAPGGVVIVDAGTSPRFDGVAGEYQWIRVTFAEKPDRAVLNALKAAGFHWGAGSWSGRRDQLPAEVLALTKQGAKETGA